MRFRSVKRSRWSRAAICLFLFLILLSVCGCRTIKFYTQAAKGQYQILTRQKPMEELLRDPKISPRLKERFQVVQELRNYAENDLSLPVDGHYLRYADLKRQFVVWNVQAAPEFSLEPKKWWYPVVGSLEYRGYFSKKGAEDYAAYLERKGLDVYVGGADAYSTLGWFKDPLLNTFIFQPDVFLAELLFHELAHQRVFASGDTDFNEAFATTVGQEAARQWAEEKGSTNQLAEYRQYLTRNGQFVDLVMRTRYRLERLYGDERTKEGKVVATDRNRDVPAEQLCKEKAEIIADMRVQYEKLKRDWGGNPVYDGWFSRPITNAKLNSIAAYYDLVPGFERLLQLNQGDWAKFYAEAERLSKMPKVDRHNWLRTLAKEETTVGERMEGQYAERPES